MEDNVQPRVDENGYRVDDEDREDLEALFNAEEDFPEVDPKVYRDIEDLILRGFLTLPAEVGGVSMVFKSINHREMDMIAWMAGSTTSKRYYDTFIAYSIFMVDGRNLLVDRPQQVPVVVELFETRLPESIRSVIIRQLSELNRRAADALAMVEAYAMERTSRWRWAQQKGIAFQAMVGIPGSESLGYNYAQLVWRALNYHEDLKEDAERQWENAKFIGSCFAGKEIRKIYNQDKQRRKQEKRDRFVRRDQILQKVILGKDVSGNEPMVGRIQIASTAEELAEQVRRSLAGERDWHDEIVARAEEIDQKNKLERERQRLELIEKAREQYRDPIVDTTTRGLTRQEVQQQTERFRQMVAQSAASHIIPLDEEEERRERVGEKYLIDTPSRER